MVRLHGTGAGMPDCTQHKRFGDLAAVGAELAFAEWWETTEGPRFVRSRMLTAALDHRRMWTVIDTRSQTDLVEVERRVCLRAIETVDLGESGFVADVINGARFIDEIVESMRSSIGGRCWVARRSS